MMKTYIFDTLNVSLALRITFQHKKTHTHSFHSVAMDVGGGGPRDEKKTPVRKANLTALNVCLHVSKLIETTAKAHIPKS